jgi:hypothetical protein
MTLLFSYGTLRDEAVQLALFGRTLVGRKDQLVGFEQAWIRVQDPRFASTSGKSDHAIVRVSRNAQARVEGTALEVTEAELLCADDYEPVEYRRVVATLASGRRAWVYASAMPNAPPS